MQLKRSSLIPAICIAVTLSLAGMRPAQSQQQEHIHDDDCISCKGYAAFKPEWHFAPHEFERRPVGDDDVLIEILYCGVCHTDLHMVAEHWMKGIFPMIPGHEIVGRVTQVGRNVTRFRAGDYAGVGCLVNSCGECEMCLKGEEQYCPKMVGTYNSIDHDGRPAMGGYSNRIVVPERFTIKVPHNVPLERVGPLLCAGITTYSPLKYCKVKPGDKVAVAGFGGLGHMAVQYAVAMGAEVTVFDLKEEKREPAREMGAVRYVNLRNEDELKGLNNSFHLIISTIPVRFDVDMYLRMLKVDGTMVLLGVPPSDQTPTLSSASLMGRRKIYGSLIGGIRETQEMLDYSVEHGIYPLVEVIPIQKLDEAYKNISEGNFMFRYVIDLQTLE
ncbi:MAG: NAD(P)-dependent alcohol dehydrogenase [Planctomycetaceae bacterium]|nr:NAD(P)-dependent alcohol dehydrogenase [Planctomycetaceae bacterium]